LEIWLERLRTEQSSLAEDVVEGRRFFWLGSGISREQAPDLIALVRHALLFLRDRATGGAGDAAEHGEALERLLGDYLPHELDLYRIAGAGWEPGDLETTRNKYSQVLGTRINGKPSNYLLMEGADVPARYGDPALQPGPEHKLLAILIAEGALAEMASGNWDGLLEKAVHELSGEPSRLSVHVVASDTRHPSSSSWIAKFHGCAVRALEAPDIYGPAIVATTAQISVWSTAQEFAHMRLPLIQNAQRLRSFVLGLSVQDANLLDVFTVAAQGLPWAWDPSHPAYVFAEPQISNTQEDVLDNCYGAEFSAHRADILKKSAVGGYSNSILAALALYVVVEKLRAALSRRSGVSAALAAELSGGLGAIEVHLARTVGDRYFRVVDFLVDGLSRLVRQFNGAEHYVTAATYTALVVGSRSHVLHDPTVTMLGADSFSTFVALIGCGVSRPNWRIRIKPRDGYLFVEVRRPEARPLLVAIVGSASAEDEVLRLPTWESGAESVVLVHSGASRPTVSRSTASRMGTGRGGRSRREVWLDDVLSVVHTTEDALENLLATSGA